MICQKCGKEFILKILINGVIRWYSRKRCFECNPYITKTERSKNKIHSGAKYICTQCNKEFGYIKKRSSKLICSNCYQRNYVTRLKEKAIDYKGGKCNICGYNYCNRALEFHHRNPKEKEFNISVKKSASWDKIRIEIDKCDLVCANCHREIHFKEVLPTNTEIKKPFSIPIRFEQTPRIKKRKLCIKCGAEIKYIYKSKSKMCKECYKVSRKVNWPPKEILIEELKTNSRCALGRKYGVSDNTVRRWIKAMNIKTGV